MTTSRLSDLLLPLFIVLYLLAAPANGVKNNCVPPEFSKGATSKIACIQCVLNGVTNDLMCNRCKNTPTKVDGSCGNPLTEKIPIKYCTEYYEYNEKCVACLKGYYLFQNECIKASREFCSVMGKVGGNIQCYSCEGGKTVPSRDLEGGCIKDEAAFNAVNSQVEGKGCRIVAAEVSEAKVFGGYRCVLCNDEFILRKSINPYTSKVQYKCQQPLPEEKLVSKVECSTGCASCDENGICSWCNHYENYFMVDRFRCVKKSNLWVVCLILGLIVFGLFV